MLGYHAGRADGFQPAESMSEADFAALRISVRLEIERFATIEVCRDMLENYEVRFNEAVAHINDFPRRLGLIAAAALVLGAGLAFIIPWGA